jgi:hypothetical protein
MNPTARKPVGLVAVAAALLVSACAVTFEAGAPFDPNKLDSALQPGISTQADVKAALGEPYGKGGALLPFHDKPRTTWTYFSERGQASTSGDMRDERTYCFVFFNGDKFDSYMWFTSTLTPLKK